MLIGEKIRSIRREKNMTISALADQIGVTTGYISQIERDLIDPSLSVLRRLCKALQTPLSVLFTEEVTLGVIAIPAETRTPVRFEDKKTTYEFLTPYIKDREISPRMEVFYYKTDPNCWLSEEVMIHEADECNYILKGEVEYHIDGEVYVIKEGGSIYIPENTPHRIRNKTDEFVEGIAIITPPTY